MCYYLGYKGAFGRRTSLPASVVLTVKPPTVTVCTDHVLVLLQAIFDWVRQVDPHGQRTLGVLTKPDQIEAGTEAQYHNIFTNCNPTRFKLELGYFAVKNPTQQELNEGWAPAPSSGSLGWLHAQHLLLADILSVVNLNADLGACRSLACKKAALFR